MATRTASLGRQRALVVAPTILATVIVMSAPLLEWRQWGEEHGMALSDFMPEDWLIVCAVLAVAVPGQLILSYGSGLWRVVVGTLLVGTAVLLAATLLSIFVAYTGGPVNVGLAVGGIGVGAHIVAAVFGFVAAIVVRDRASRVATASPSGG